MKIAMAFFILFLCCKRKKPPVKALLASKNCLAKTKRLFIEKAVLPLGIYAVYDTI